MKRKATEETPEQKAYREMVEQIAGNIASLARAVTSLLHGPLNRKAITLLLAQSSGLSQERVGFVLRALENMEADWLNKK